MKERPLSPPPRVSADELPEALQQWLGGLPGLIPYTEKIDASIDIASVASGAVSIQAFTVVGVTSSDTLIVSIPGLPSGLNLLANPKASTDQLELRLWNSSGAPIDPGVLPIVVWVFR